MALTTSGEIIVEVDCATAFNFVQDPQRLALCIPGCQDLREVSPGRFQARLTSTVAFVTLGFDVAIEMTNVDPPHAIEARIAGDAVRQAARVSATAGLQLAGLDARRTRIQYRADVALTGKLGGIGEPVFRATSARLARQFGQNLKAAIEQDGTA